MRKGDNYMLFKNKTLIVFAFLAVIGIETKAGGQLLNILVMKANGGKMPVLAEESRTVEKFLDPTRHSYPLLEETLPVRFSFLCDRFTIVPSSFMGRLVINRLAMTGNFPGFRATHLFISYGDVLIVTGGLLSVFASDFAWYGFIVWGSWKYLRRRIKPRNQQPLEN